MLTYFAIYCHYAIIVVNQKMCPENNYEEGTFLVPNSLQPSSDLKHRSGRSPNAVTQRAILFGGRNNMSEFEAEVKKAEQELNQGLVPVSGESFTDKVTTDEFLGDLKMQAQEYGQKIQDAAAQAKDFASDKFAQASDKFKEISAKDPKELVEDAKEFARQKPGQTILISAAVGLVLGLILRGRK